MLRLARGVARAAPAALPARFYSVFRALPHRHGHFVQRLGFHALFEEKEPASVLHAQCPAFVRRWYRVPRSHALGHDRVHIGVLAPKAVDARATARNRERRRVYGLAASIVRRGQAPMVRPGDVLVFSLVPGVERVPTAELAQHILRAMEPQASRRAAARGKGKRVAGQPRTGSSPVPQRRGRHRPLARATPSVPPHARRRGGGGDAAAQSPPP